LWSDRHTLDSVSSPMCEAFGVRLEAWGGGRWPELSADQDMSRRDRSPGPARAAGGSAHADARPASDPVPSAMNVARASVR